MSNGDMIAASKAVEMKLLVVCSSCVTEHAKKLMPFLSLGKFLGISLLSRHKLLVIFCDFRSGIAS